MIQKFNSFDKYKQVMGSDRSYEDFERHQGAVAGQAEVKTELAAKQINMGPQNTDAVKAEVDRKDIILNKVQELETKIEYTPDNAASASEMYDQKHKSSYKKKKEEKTKNKQKKAAEELRLKVAEGMRDRELERLKEISSKTKEMDAAFLQQREAADDLAAELNEECLKVWKNQLTEDEKESLIAYTADYKTAGNTPHYTTMNDILRRGEYRIGGGKDAELKYPEDLNLNRELEVSDIDYDLIATSKQNYNAVTNCIEALSKSKLPRDMVFRRGSNMVSLSYMLGIDVTKGNEYIEKTIRNNLEEYWNGSKVIFDRGFLSTTPYSDVGLEHHDKVEWIIQGHAGDEALFLGNKSHFPDEGEVLFQAGTKFRVLGVYPPESRRRVFSGGEQTWKVYLETIPRLKPLRGVQ